MGTLIYFLLGCFVGYFGFSLLLMAFLTAVRELFSDDKPDKFAAFCVSVLWGFMLWQLFYWAYSDGEPFVYGIIVAMIWANLADD